MEARPQLASLQYLCNSTRARALQDALCLGKLWPQQSPLYCLQKSRPSLVRDCSVGSGSAQMWPQLMSLKCLCNSIPAMDASLATLPAVQTCDLSSNNISIVQVKWDPFEAVLLTIRCRCGL